MMPFGDQKDLRDAAARQFGTPVPVPRPTGHGLPEQDDMVRAPRFNSPFPDPSPFNQGADLPPGTPGYNAKSYDENVVSPDSLAGMQVDLPDHVLDQVSLLRRWQTVTNNSGGDK